ncbi:ArsR family transcriptional regulator [Yersinia entomophaga]|uniref:ArsR family transcriptional regulator n=1 Tax=Yersinia entomophaga TaxID=935293 RepID=A0ABN4PVW1_YERET|nr:MULTISPECIES: metalloregulator ArsR/SmtB family transcription factor [Yersinia]ANI30035.1 ArsR family transcriptional regulator [Yersinia entomophaga]OWF87143.1 transcriptional regulator [Yersinia entomophaga]
MSSKDTLSLNLMSMGAAEACGTLRMLANEDRLLLLCQISQGEKSVGELETLLNIHQPTLSQQLGALRNEGLVTTRREGKRIYYSIADRRILAILHTLYELYCPKEGEGIHEH